MPSTPIAVGFKSAEARNLRCSATLSFGAAVMRTSAPLGFWLPSATLCTAARHCPWRHHPVPWESNSRLRMAQPAQAWPHRGKETREFDKEILAGESRHNIAAPIESVLPEKISQVSGKACRLAALGFSEGKWKMEIFDGFPPGQTATKPDSLDGCLPDIQSDTFGNHGVKAISGLALPSGPGSLVMELRILQG